MRRNMLVFAITVIALCTLIAFPLLANGSSENTATGQTKGAAVSPAGVFPIVQQKTDLSVFIVGTPPLVDDFQNNAYVDYIEKKTNVHLVVGVAKGNASEQQQKRNVMLASGDFPDVFIDGGFTKAQQLLYGQQGVLLPLNELIDKYGHGIKQAFKDFPLVKANMTLPDGNIYSLPDINDCFHCSMAQKMWIYQPWLDKLGLKMPTTTEEFRQVLEAFKTKDPNGNGKADEIPLAGATSGWYAGIDGFLMDAFILDNGNLADSAGDRLLVKAGKVEAAYAQPQYREGLRYIHSLYAEGLISPESFVQDSTQYQQMGENPGTVILGAGAGGHMGVFTQFQGESGRWLDYKTVPPLKGPDGYRIARYIPVYGNDSWAITNKAKNPALAFRVGDAFYEMDFMLRDIYGIEGKDWRYAKPGEIGINGKPAIWVAIVGRGKIGRTTWWNQAGPQERTRDFRLGRLNQGPKTLEVILFNQTKKNYEPYQADPSMLVPPLAYSDSDAAALVDYETSLHNYVDEMTARFITGDANIETEWDSYLNQLRKIGIDQYLKIVQKAYDANKQ